MAHYTRLNFFPRVSFGTLKKTVGKKRKCWLQVFFLLFAQCFLQLFCLGVLTLFQTSPVFTCLLYNSFEKTVGKGEIARSEQFLLFPQCFLFSKNFLSFPSNLKLSPASTFRLEESKICLLGKG